MMISKFLTNVGQRTALLTLGCSQMSSEFQNKINPLQFKILETKTLQDFFKIFEQNKDAFTFEIINFASKTISNLTSETRGRVDGELALPYLRFVASQPIEKLNEREVINFMATFRFFERKNFYLNEFRDYRNSLVTRFQTILKESKSEFVDVNFLFSALFEFAYIKSNAASLIASKLNYHFNEEQKKNQKLNITHNQLSFALHSLVQFDYLQRSLKQLRNTILKKIEQELPSIKESLLVNMACDLSQFDLSDWNGYENFLINKVYSRVFSIIKTLDQKSIFSILRCDCKDNQNFRRIIYEIMTNLTFEISASGEVPMNQMLFLSLITNSGSKISLKSLEPETQKRILIFLKAIIQKGDTPDREFEISQKLKDLITNNFFPYPEKQAFSQLLNSSTLNFRLDTAYELCIHGFNVPKIFEEFKNFQEDKSKMSVAQYYIIISNLASRSPQHVELQAKLKEVEQKVADIYSSPQKFVAFFDPLIKNKDFVKLIFHFHHQFGEKNLEKLPSPFVGEPTPEQSTFSFVYGYYLTICITYKSKHFKRWQELQEKIDHKLLGQIIKKHINQQKDQIFCNQQLLQVVARKLNKNNKDNDLLLFFTDCAITLLTKYASFAVFNRNDVLISSIWRLHHSIIRNFDKLVTTNPEYEFRMINLWENYLNRSLRNYNVEIQYKRFVNHLLANLNKFKKNKNLANSLIENAIRLNLLTKKHLQEFNADDVRSYLLKETIKTIKDDAYTPMGLQISQKTLPLIFQNKNMMGFIGLNIDQITEQISKNPPAINIQCLKSFNQEKSGQSIAIVKAISQSIIQKAKNFQTLDFVTLVENLNDKQLSRNYQVKKLIEKLLEAITERNIRNYSIDYHADIIRSINAIAGLKISNYLNAVVESVEKKDKKDYLLRGFYLSLASVGYPFTPEQMKKIEFFDSTPRSALYLFLLFEKHLEPELKAKLIEKILVSLKKADTEGDEKAGQTPDMLLDKVYYNYFKNQYPNETKDLDLSAFKLNNSRWLHNFDHSKQILTKLAEFTKNPLNELSFDGENNKYFRIQNCVFAFCQPRLVNSTWHQELLTRVIHSLIPETDVKVILLPANYFSLLNLAETLKTRAPGFLNEEQEKGFSSFLQAEKDKKHEKVEEETAA